MTPPSIQDRIELGQDLNNAWALVAAWSSFPVEGASPGLDEADRWFDSAFKLVQKKNAAKRASLDAPRSD